MRITDDKTEFKLQLTYGKEVKCSGKNRLIKFDLTCMRPFVITDLQSQFKTTSVYVIPVLHSAIYRVPERVDQSIFNSQLRKKITIKKWKRRKAYD